MYSIILQLFYVGNFHLWFSSVYAQIKMVLIIVVLYLKLRKIGTSALTITFLKLYLTSLQILLAAASEVCSFANKCALVLVWIDSV